MVVGAGPVPARWPARGNVRGVFTPNVALWGHRACPYCGKKALDMGYIILNILLTQSQSSLG